MCDFFQKIVARYKVPKEILVVLKHINSSCKYMIFASTETSSSMEALSQEQTVFQFSYDVPEAEQDWQAWSMAKIVHPAFMEAIYRGY